MCVNLEKVPPLEEVRGRVTLLAHPNFQTSHFKVRVHVKVNMVAIYSTSELPLFSFFHETLESCVRQEDYQRQMP